MAHWHDFNPWTTRCVYISADEMREVLGGRYPDERLAAYGGKMDAYILPQKSGDYSFGIRYGKEKEDYLSPAISKDQGDAIMASRNFAGII